jgi:hypothetical protein
MLLSDWIRKAYSIVVVTSNYWNYYSGCNQIVRYDYWNFISPHLQNINMVLKWSVKHTVEYKMIGLITGTWMYFLLNTSALPEVANIDP